MIKDFICSECEKKCAITVNDEYEQLDIKGNLCSEGIKRAKLEIKSNKGILTTLVRIKGAEFNVVSVKSTHPIDKNLWVECSKALSRLYVGAPIKIGDIICKNILNTGVDIICTKNIS